MFGFRSTFQALNCCGNLLVFSGTVFSPSPPLNMIFGWILQPSLSRKLAPLQVPCPALPGRNPDLGLNLEGSSFWIVAENRQGVVIFLGGSCLGFSKRLTPASLLRLQTERGVSDVQGRVEFSETLLGGGWWGTTPHLHLAALVGWLKAPVDWYLCCMFVHHLLLVLLL